MGRFSSWTDRAREHTDVRWQRNSHPVWARRCGVGAGPETTDSRGRLCRWERSAGLGRAIVAPIAADCAPASGAQTGRSDSPHKASHGHDLGRAEILADSPIPAPHAGMRDGTSPSSCSTSAERWIARPNFSRAGETLSSGVDPSAVAVNRYRTWLINWD